MKIEVLKYFIVLAESGSISEAARKLYIAQPSLTKALQLFEQELGVSLFERGRGGISLTPAGEKILPEAREMVRYYEGWLELGHQNTLMSVDIFVGRSFADFLLPHILVEFGQKYPDTPVNYVISVNPGEHISRSARKPAAALLACNDQDLQAYTRIQGNPPVILMKGESRCLVSSKSPLSQKETVTKEDLKGQFMMLPGSRADAGEIPAAGPDIAGEILRTFPAEQRIFVGALSSVISQTAENPGTFALSFYPALKRYERVKTGELRAIPFEGHMGEMKLCLFYSRKAAMQHPRMKELVGSIRQSFRQFEE